MPATERRIFPADPGTRQLMTPEVADAILRIESHTFVRCVEWFAELGSTNDRALEIAGDPSLETPRLIWTDRQHAGRGRSGNAWWSARGALTFSLLLNRADWQLPVALWSLVSGLAIADAIAENLPGGLIQVKWPNDVYLKERKVAGILMESTTANVDRVVIGVGINVANSFREAPADLQQFATAMIDHSPVPPLPVAILLDVLTHWQDKMAAIEGDPPSLVTAWERRSLLTNRRVRLQQGDKTLEGECRGIDSDGALLIETSHGLERRISGTVRAL